jgi:copper chaperone CopZ
VGEPALFDGVPQRLDDVVLPQNIIEGLWPVFSRKNLVTHGFQSRDASPKRDLFYLERQGSVEECRHDSQRPFTRPERRFFSRNSRGFRVSAGRVDGRGCGLPDRRAGHGLESALEPVNGVEEVRVDVAAKQVAVGVDSSVIGDDVALRKAIEGAGYQVGTEKAGAAE